MLLSRFVVGMLLVAMMVLGAGEISGQDYPNKAIRISAGPAGGGGDFIARQIAQGISGPLGQPVIVENRVAILGAELVSKAPPDGYNLLVAGAVLWILPLLQKTSYDVARDFSPISLISREVNVLVVHPSLPVKSVKELIALGKARPGELNAASGITGSPAHLATELFKSMAGVNIVIVPYKGQAAGVAALLSGEVEMRIMDAGLVPQYAQSGRLRALAVTSTTPSALAPGLPTVAASGLPGYEAVNMTGIWAPGKTPAAVINRLNQEIVRVLTRAEVKERFLSAGAEIVGSSPDEFAAVMRSDMARMGKIIKDAGIKVE